MAKPVTLVTGGASGIGMATSMSRAARGQRIVVLDRNDPPGDLRCEFHRLDFSDRQGLEAILQAIVAGSAVTRIVNCAGVALGELWFLTELAEWLRADQRGSFFLTAPPLRLPGAVGSPVTPVATV